MLKVIKNVAKGRMVELFGSQYGFAQKIGVSETVVSKVIRGKIELSEMNRKIWCNTLRLKPGELFEEVKND